MLLRVALVLAVVLATAVNLHAASAAATVNSIDANGVGAPLGTITFRDTKNGLLITPSLSGLPAGVHGFHIHEKGACGPAEHEGKPAAGFAAGGHYDPGHTAKHLGPYSSAGHKGDLPILVVDQEGKSTLPILAPHLRVEDVRGRSIMIHAGADNYSDQPTPLGGGGARLACGVIK